MSKSKKVDMELRAKILELTKISLRLRKTDYAKDFGRMSAELKERIAKNDYTEADKRRERVDNLIAQFGKAHTM